MLSPTSAIMRRGLGQDVALLKQWKAPRPRYTPGVLAKYARQVSSAHVGAVTDLDLFA